MTCMFTGHRIIRNADKGRLRTCLIEEMENMYSAGVRTFISGAALGFDILAATTVLEFRKKYTDVRLSLYLPCKDQQLKWRESEKLVYAKVLEAADEVKYISQEYTPYCMRARNDAMVNASEHCIAYCYKDFGGTAYTVKRALQADLNMVMI